MQDLIAKLRVPKLVKKFPSFYGNRRFIASFTRAHHLSLSWARFTQYILPSHFLKIHFNITLPSPSGSAKFFSSRSPYQNPLCTSFVFRKCYMPRLSHFSWFDPPKIFGVMCSSPLSSYLVLLGPSLSHNTLFSNTFNLCSSSNV
jgi:hypothetical protein